MRWCAWNIAKSAFRATAAPTPAAHGPFVRPRTKLLFELKKAQAFSLGILYTNAHRRRWISVQTMATPHSHTVDSLCAKLHIKMYWFVRYRRYCLIVIYIHIQLFHVKKRWKGIGILPYFSVRTTFRYWSSQHHTTAELCALAVWVSALCFLVLPL